MQQINYEEGGVTKNKITGKLLTAIFVIILLVIGGSAIGYFYYFQNTPEKVLEKMVTRLSEVESFGSQGEIKFEVVGEATNDLYQSSDFLINYDSQIDIKEIENIKLALSFIADFYGYSGLEDLSEAKEKMRFGLELRNIDKTIYFKLNELPNFGIFDLSFLAGGWFKLEVDDIAENFGFEKSQELLEGNKLSSSQAEEIRQVFSQAEIFKVTEELAGEKIEGSNTYHYKYSINEDNLRELMIDISEIIQDEPLSEEDLAELDEAWGSTEFVGGEIWIGKKDFLPYKLFLKAEMKDEINPEVVGKMTINLMFRNYNQPVEIDVPSAIDIKEVLNQLFSESLFDSDLDSDFDSDLDLDFNVPME
jgi:hypothetical protein